MRKTLLFVSFGIILILLFGFSSVGAEQQPSSVVESISVLTYPTRTVYGAFEKLDTDGLTLRAVFSDGRERILDGSEVSVSYGRDKCFRVGDDSVLLSYGGQSIRLPVTVNRISYDISSLELVGFSVEYNGLMQGYEGDTERIIGLDGLPLIVSFSGGGEKVGVYDVSVDFYTESRDYLTPESRVIQMTVLPARAEIVWEQLSFVYDGRSKSPKAYYTDVRGERIYPSVSGAATNAGEGYIASAVIADPNYEFSNCSVFYEIRKADYDFSDVVWSNGVFVYDGSKKSVSLSGLPSGVSVLGYTGDIGLDAGIYTAGAMLKWDENNYNPPPPLTNSWEIKKADYDMSAVSFRNGSYIFDGKTHYPTLIGEMPVGADGITLEYSFSGGACHVSEGNVSVTVSFHTASKNYNIPSEIFSGVVVLPRGIRVAWGEKSLPYNGEYQSPSASAVECGITVTGGMLGVGKYLATATADSSDYYVINEKIEYRITKADNYWTTIPENSICYEGKGIIPKGKSRFGEVRLSFFADINGEVEIDSPTACGSYYVRLYVDETDNYSGLISEMITIEILPIIPVSFIAEIKRTELKAYERLSGDDYYCAVINNDGSVTEIDKALINVIYESADSLRKKDGKVRFEYGDFVIDLSVEVEYADYDLREVEWTGRRQTYDGSAKTPAVIGLPDGVRVVGYIGGERIDSGSYTVSAVLEYDRENYNEPLIEPCEFVIEKALIAPSLISLEYNGKNQLPISNSPLYKVINAEEYKNVGEYSVLVELTDPSNYSFEGGYDRAYAVFKILPLRLEIIVEDVRLRLFEELEEVDYRIISGSVLEGDELGLTAYREGKSVLLRTDNPNYYLDLRAGRFIRLPYPTLDGFVILFSLISLFLVILVSLLYALKNRHRIAGAVEIVKCRWRNRGYKAPLPTEEDSIEYDRGIAASFDIDIDIIDSALTEEEITDKKVKDDLITDLAIVDFEINAERANALITNSLAKRLINREGEIVYTDGGDRENVRLDLLSKSFNAGERVDVNSLKKKGLISSRTAYIKIIGEGSIDKPLMVYANDFSLSAVKMIALAGGRVTKVVTFKDRKRN